MPCKQADMCKHWPDSGLMLAASAQNRPSSGMSAAWAFIIIAYINCLKPNICLKPKLTSK